MTISLDIGMGGKTGRVSGLQGSNSFYSHVNGLESHGVHKKLKDRVHAVSMNLGNCRLFEVKGLGLQPSWKSSCLVLKPFSESRLLGYFHIHGSLPSVSKLARVTATCNYTSGSSNNDAMGGDPEVQKMLVEMLQIQVGKARMSEFVDERSQHLRNIAQDACEEYDRIAFRTMKEFEATGSRVLRELDADASAIERELQIARKEIEAQSKDFEEFQLRSAYSRNEGLFFKNLYQAPRVLRYKSYYPSSVVKKEITVVAPTTSKDFSIGYTQILYGGLSLVIVSFIWSSGSALLSGIWMRPSKLASYGVIISLLLTQLANVKVITGEDEADPNKKD